MIGVECIIIGKTNVGKTLFAINFAEYLGCKVIKVTSIYPDGRQIENSFTIREAILQLTNEKPHKTRCLNKIAVTIPVGKKKKHVMILDSTGIIDGIHPESNVRKAISQTLAKIRECKIILHMIDVSNVINRGLVNSLGEVDYQIANFAQMRTGYVMLANKIDIPGSETGLNKLREEFPANLILPISALYKRGFKEVKDFVIRNI